ncbi:MAG TPA: hypothetical protein VM511_09930 [Luteolibacter sp.]|nr:hypothetical protein [Luteolibacter sp.]
MIRSTLAAIACFSLFLPSCSPLKNVPLADGSILKGKSVVRAERKMPALAAVTPGKAVGLAFGAIGGAIAGAAMVSAGNEIVRTNHVEDPAAVVSKDLTPGMAKHYGMKSSGSRFVSVDKPQEIAKACSGVDYVLDVRTLFWQFGYRPFRLGTYWVTHNQQLRLIDCRTGKVVAEGYFSWNPSDESHFYDYDTLAENGAVGLKKEVKFAADGAKNHFKGSILKF